MTLAEARAARLKGSNRQGGSARTTPYRLSGRARCFAPSSASRRARCAFFIAVRRDRPRSVRRQPLSDDSARSHQGARRRLYRRTGSREARRSRYPGHHRADAAPRPRGRPAQPRRDRRPGAAPSAHPRSLRAAAPHRRERQRRGRPPARLAARAATPVRRRRARRAPRQEGRRLPPRRPGLARLLRVPRLGRQQPLSAARRRGADVDRRASRSGRSSSSWSRTARPSPWRRSSGPDPSPPRLPRSRSASRRRSPKPKGRFRSPTCAPDAGSGPPPSTSASACSPPPAASSRPSTATVSQTCDRRFRSRLPFAE